MSSMNPQHVLTVGNDLADDEIVNLMSAEEADHRVPTTTSSMSDGTINYISAEVLEAAGINLESAEVSEEQLNTLLSLAGQPSVSEPATIMPRMAVKREAPQSSHSDLSENVTVSLTPEGVAVTTDAGQRRFYFTGEQLAANNIDINNLSEDAIHQIISMALSALHTDKGNENKRRKLDADLPLSGLGQLRCEAAAHEEKLIGHSVSPSTSGLQKASNPETRTSQVALIGEEVDVKRNGRLVPAKIRYCRGGGGYKVQFSDGHFEWVGSEQIQVRAGPSKTRSDHESYSGLSDVSYAKSSSAANSGIGRRPPPPAIPGIKVTPQNGFEKDIEPNFCCVVCDRKLYQKEVKYLTIRVPACDECTQLKMMVMDTVEDYREVSKKPCRSPPTAMSNEAPIPEEVANSPRVPEELLEAPPILHRLDSPVQHLECDPLKENESVSSF